MEGLPKFHLAVNQKKEEPQIQRIQVMLELIFPGSGHQDGKR